MPGGSENPLDDGTISAEHIRVHKLMSLQSGEPPNYCKARNLRPYNPRDCMAPDCPCRPPIAYKAG